MRHNSIFPHAWEIKPS